jgi:HKD family nuclease
MGKLVPLFNASLQTGFVDKKVLSTVEFQPELLVNQKNPRRKILSSLLHELENCTDFFISVAFVTTGGEATIINKLKELENRGITGK